MVRSETSGGTEITTPGKNTENTAVRIYVCMHLSMYLFMYAPTTTTTQQQAVRGQRGVFFFFSGSKIYTYIYIDSSAVHALYYLLLYIILGVYL